MTFGYRIPQIYQPPMVVINSWHQLYDIYWLNRRIKYIDRNITTCATQPDLILDILHQLFLTSLYIHQYHFIPRYAVLRISEGNGIINRVVKLRKAHAHSPQQQHKSKRHHQDDHYQYVKQLKIRHNLPVYVYLYASIVQKNGPLESAINQLP